MKIEFDQAKSDKNLRERQLSFDRASDFDWSSAVIASDLRNEYLEARSLHCRRVSRQSFTCALFHPSERRNPSNQLQKS